MTISTTISKWTVLKNATANVLRGGSSAIVAIVLPHFLTLSMNKDRYSGWALMLQIVAYVNYLDFGLQTAVARFVAGAIENRDNERLNGVFNTALLLLAGTGAVALACLAGVAVKLTVLFSSVPSYLAVEMGRGVLVLGVAAALGLPLSAYAGVLVGIQKNEFPAASYSISRLAGAGFVIAVSRATDSLVVLASVLALCNLLAPVSLCFIAQWLVPQLRLSLKYLRQSILKELTKYCAALSVWSLAMLLVTGLSAIIVGIYDFRQVASFSLATTLIAFFIGLVNAAFTSMLAPIAMLQARGEYGRIRQILLETTALNAIVGIVAVTATYTMGSFAIRHWVGEAYLDATFSLLKILMIAQAVRLIGNAYGTVLVGMGLQRYGIYPALLEGGLNLSLSVAGMRLMGATGVAWASLVAGAAGLCAVVFYIMPRIPLLDLRPRIFLRESLAGPVVPFLPALIWLVLHSLAASHSLLPAVYGHAIDGLALVFVCYFAYRRFFAAMRGRPVRE